MPAPLQVRTIIVERIAVLRMLSILIRGYAHKQQSQSATSRSTSKRVFQDDRGQVFFPQ